MTDFRALCAELVNELFGYKVANPMHDRSLVNRACAALDEPEGHGLTEDQLDVMVIAIQALIPSPNPWDTHSLAAVDRGREILQRAFARWGRPVVSAVEPIPVSERLPEDADCLVIPPLGASTFSRRYCWQAREIMHCGQARLIWDWKLVPLTTDKHWPFTYWLPASTRFLPTTVDPAKTNSVADPNEAEA